MILKIIYTTYKTIKFYIAEVVVSDLVDCILIITRYGTILSKHKKVDIIYRPKLSYKSMKHNQINRKLKKH